MKIQYILLVLIGTVLGTWLLAQQRMPPGPPEFAVPNTNQAAAVPPGPVMSTNQAEEMVRALRKAMTNAPASATNSPIPLPAAPATSGSNAAATQARPVPLQPIILGGATGQNAQPTAPVDRKSVV